MAAGRSGDPRANGAAYSIAWALLLGLTVFVSLESHYGLVEAVRANGAHLAADFIVFWTAASAAKPYDFEALTAAQYWYMATDAIRPFAYPPSFLPWLQPFSGLPMLWAYGLWVAATAALFAAAWMRLARPSAVLAGTIAPVSAMAVLPGQMVFLLGALLVAALQLVKSRPVVAGILLGIAATLKPQTLVLVPLALIAGRHWRTLGAAALSGFAIGVVCVAVQGAQLWVEWLESLPRFAAVVHDSGMIEFGATAATLMAQLGVTGPASVAVQLLTAAIGAAAVWTAFRRTESPFARLIALNAGTVLVLPYSMPYELALSAPAMAAVLLDRRLHPVAWFAAFFMLTNAVPLIGPLAVCGIVLLRSRLLGTPGNLESRFFSMAQGPKRMAGAYSSA